MFTTLCASVESRLSEIETDEVDILATILGPRLKISWCKDRNLHDRYIQKLKYDVSHLNVSPAAPEKEHSPLYTKRMKATHFWHLA